MKCIVSTWCTIFAKLQDFLQSVNNYSEQYKFLKEKKLLGNQCPFLLNLWLRVLVLSFSLLTFKRVIDTPLKSESVKCYIPNSVVVKWHSSMWMYFSFAGLWSSHTKSLGKDDWNNRRWWNCLHLTTKHELSEKTLHYDHGKFMKITFHFTNLH